MEKYQYFNGLKFTKDEKTGYYLNSTIHERIHRYVYKFYKGEIPEGYDIHHKDNDKSNNDISNLEMIKKHDHQILHGSLLTDEKREKLRRNFEENARPKACEWHKSEAGRNWHKQHYEEMKQNLHKKRILKCQNCKKEYIAERGKFCSNACSAAARRKQGIDNIIKNCEICGKEFSSNKYAKVRTCSRSCAAKLSWIERNEKQK